MKSTKETKKSKKPTTHVGFSATEELNEQLNQISKSRKQAKSTIIKICIEESLHADLHSENLIYNELAKIMNNKELSDKAKLSDTKKLIKQLISLRRHTYE